MNLEFKNWCCLIITISTFSGGKSRMIVLGEVPPSQPEQEQESAQDVAAQWLQSEDQRTATSAAGGILAATSRKKQDVPPVPQPRQRIAKERPDVRVLPSNRNRKSRRRRITVAGNHLIHHRHTMCECEKYLKKLSF